MKCAHLLFVVILTACNSTTKPEAASAPRDKTAEAIGAYINSHAHDPSSYQPIHTGPPTPFHRADSARYAALQLFESKSRADHEIGYKLMDGVGKDSALVIGQAVVHTYRIKNVVGGLQLDSTLFIVYNTGKAIPINGR